MEALAKLAERGEMRLTPADLLARGMAEDVATARSLLAQLLACPGAGYIEAHNEEIIYIIRSDASKKLKQSESEESFRLMCSWILDWSLYLLRISFGIMLILSVVLLFIAIIALLVLRSSQGHGGEMPRDVHRFLPNWPMYWWFFFQPPGPRPRRRRRHRDDKLDYEPVDARPDPEPERPPPGSLTETQNQPTDDDMNFLQVVFSFLFGDGDPNRDFEKHRWQQIGISSGRSSKPRPPLIQTSMCTGALIRHNGGCVIAEQVAPFMDSCLLPQAKRSLRHEEFMLELTAKFEGTPVASEDGKLFYTFRTLMTRGVDEEDLEADIDLAPPPPLETLWRFSHAPAEKLQWVAGLAALNLVEVFIVRSLLLAARSQHVPLSLLRLLEWLWSGLAFYAAAFLLVPALRWLLLQLLDHRIRTRNRCRKETTPRLLKTLAEQADKLERSRHYAVGPCHL